MHDWFLEEEGSLMSLRKVFIGKYLPLRGKLLAPYFMRLEKSSLLNAREGVFQMARWFQKKSVDDPRQVYRGGVFVFHHTGTSGLNFQIFSCMISDI